MKIRQGFVSNSSSSSFICNSYVSNRNVVFDKQQVIDKLHIIYKAARELEILEVPYEDVFRDPYKATKNHITALNKDWGTNIEWNNKMFIIDSVYDNSIPSEFFDLIESLFMAERVHLG